MNFKILIHFDAKRFLKSTQHGLGFVMEWDKLLLAMSAPYSSVMVHVPVTP